MNAVKNYIYYVLIFIISLVALVFFPMIGSSGDIAMELPTTTGGWILYCTKNGLTAILNVLIFYSFLQQGEVNVRDNEKYREANEILANSRHKGYTPSSPRKWKAKQWLSKGFSIFMSTLTSAVALTNAILSYDYMSLITYTVVVVMGVVFGFISMKGAEKYWTGEFWEYAMGVRFLEEHQIQKAKLVRALTLFRINTAKYVRKEEINRCLQSIVSNTATLKSK